MDQKDCPSTQWFCDMLTSRKDSLEPYRDRILLSMGAITELLLTPFTINNLLQGREAVAFALLVVQIALLADLYATWNRRPPPVPRAALLVPFVIGMTAAIVEQGVPGLLWGYPVVVFCYFVLNRGHALIGSVVVILYLSAMAWYFVSPALALRLLATLLLTFIMINIVLNVIFDLHQSLASQALTDPLTGTFNRRFMDRNLEAAIARFQRQSTPASILMIDADDFKEINDRFGHLQGDAVLQKLAQSIRERMRLGDRLFRYGGEEFLLLLEDTPESGASIVAEDIRRNIEVGEILPGRNMTVSIGISAYCPGQSVDDWLRSADSALYAAKEAGRNCVRGSQAMAVEPGLFS